MTGCSCALTLAERGLRVRLHEAREIAGGASGRNGGFALRGAAMRYDEARTRRSAPERARLLWTLTERSLDRMEALAGDAFRRVGSLRLAADEAERDALAARVRRAARGRVRGRVGRRARRRRSTGSSRRAPPSRRRCARTPRAGCAGSPRARPRRAPRSSRARRVDLGTTRRRGRGRRRRRRAHRRRSLPELAAVVVPVRGQVLATEPLAERLYDRPALRARGLRLLAAAARRPARARRQARRELRDRADRRRRDDAARSRSASTSSSASCSARAPRGHAPLGRDLGRDARPAAARRPRPGPRRRLGRRRLLGPRQRARPRLRRPRRRAIASVR